MKMIKSDIQNTEPWTAINMNNPQPHTMEEINFRNTTQSKNSQAPCDTMYINFKTDEIGLNIRNKSSKRLPNKGSWLDL